MNTTKIPQKRSGENLRTKRKKLIELLKYNAQVKTKYIELISNLSLRAKNILRHHDLWDTEGILPWVEGKFDDFSKLRNCGQKTSQELNLMLDEFRSYVYSFMLEESENKVISDTNNCLDRNELIGVFDSLLTTLSVRSFNVLDKAHLLDIDSFCRYFYNLEIDPTSLPNCGSKSAAEIKQIVYILQKYVKNTAQHSSTTTNVTEKNIASDVIINAPSSRILLLLSDQDKDFMIDFKTAHGHWPMFYLLQSYFIHSTRKTEKDFATIWGMCDGRALTLEAGAQMLNQSKVLLKQKITFLIDHPNDKLKGILEMEDWRFYSVINTKYSVNVRYEEIIHEERLKSVLCVPVLLSFFGKQLYMFNTESLSVSNFYINSESDVPIILDKKYACFNIRKVLAEIKRLSKIKSEIDIKIPLHSYFIINENYWDSATVFEHMGDKDWQLLLVFLEDILKNCKDVLNHNLIIKASTINYQETIYTILRESGTRLHTNEIFERLKLKCQKLSITCKFVNSAQIKRFLISDERIVAVGKSSFWGLKEWGGMLGSIKEVAIELVKQSDSPVKINDLAKIVMMHRPDSTEKSIVSVIWNCTYSGELIIFFDNLVGLPEKEYQETYVRFPQSFEEWIATFKEFVVKNKRFPRSGKTGYEGYLNRWYLKSKQLVGLSPEEILKFEQLEKEVEIYPHNAKEEQFLLNCELYKSFVKSLGGLVRREDDASLFNWFYNIQNKLSSKAVDSFSENQKQYLMSLLQFLSEQSYELDDNEQEMRISGDKELYCSEMDNHDRCYSEMDDNGDHVEEMVTSVDSVSIEKGNKTLPIRLKPVPKKPTKKIPVPRRCDSVNSK